MAAEGCWQLPGQTAALNAVKNRWLRHVAARDVGSCLGKAAEGFGAFGGGQAAALNALKTDAWGMWLQKGVGSCLGKGCGRVWGVWGRANGSLERR